MADTSFKQYKAFGEESDDSSAIRGFEKRLKHQLAGQASASERSFGSDESKWSLLHSNFVGGFDQHIARGIGDANSVRSSLSDNLLHDLDEIMASTVPVVEGSTIYDHPRQISLYLERLRVGLPAEHPGQQHQELTFIHKLLALVHLTHADNAVVDGENVASNARQSSLAFLKTLLKRSFVLFCALVFVLVFVFGTFVLAHFYNLDLPDFFTHGMFLLVVAVVVAVIML